MGNEVLEQIIKIKDAVPKKQRILCNYLALNYEKIGVMTVAELAENAGVGSTTVMRLVQLLGFDSYTTFKKALAQESLLKNKTPYRKIAFVKSLNQALKREGFTDVVPDNYFSNALSSISQL